MASKETWIRFKNEGAKHFQNQQWPKASDCYTRALSEKPDEAILYSNRAICGIRLKKFDPAREDAERAVRLDPKNVKFYRVLSEALLGLGSYEKALEVCEKGLKLQPQEPTLLARLQDCKSKITATNHQSQHSGCQKRKNANASQPIDEIQGCSTEKKNRIESESDQWESDSEDPSLEEEYCNDPRFEMAAFFGPFEGLSGSCVDHNPVRRDPRLLIPATIDRHQRGWPSAKICLETVNKMLEAQELLRQKKYTESFVKIREMDIPWILGIFNRMPFLEAARKTLKRDPNNHPAMYIIVAFDPSQENRHKLKFSRRCVELASSVPQYHEILAVSYAATNQGNQSIRSLEKSIKLHAKPSLLSLRAVFLKNLIHAKDEVVIEAFQQFLASAPSDYENVPSAYFQMGSLFTTNNPAKAAALYRLGQIADHSSIRLPCFANLGDDVVRMGLKIRLHRKGYWPIPGNILDCVKMCFTCTKTDSLYPCTTCNKAWYCSKQCQENNHIIHKRFCRH